MKITILSTFYPFRGGIAQFNANMYRALEREHEVKAITFKRQYPDFLFPGETQMVAKDDPSDKIPAERLVDTINPLTYYSTAKKIRKDEPDLLLMKYWMTFFAPSLGTIAKKMSKKTKRICVLDNLIPHEKRFFDKAFNQYYVKQIDGFVVMSDSVLNDLIKTDPNVPYLRIDHPLYDHFGELRDKKESLKKLGLDTEKKYALFFGIIRDYKGLDLLIEAMKSVDDGIELIVAGEVYGSFEKYLKLIETHKLGDKIHLFNKYIGDEEVPDFFSAADVCVLPYRSATQSGITSISYHFELPIIATDVGGLKETITHMETGLIVDNPEPEEISKSINLYFKENLKDKFEPFIHSYKKKHSWINFTDELIQFSKKIKRRN